MANSDLKYSAMVIHFFKRNKKKLLSENQNMELSILKYKTVDVSAQEILNPA